MLSSIHEARYCETTQRDEVERGVRGGFRIGDTCAPVANSC